MNEQQNEWAWLDEALKDFELNLADLDLDIDLLLPKDLDIDFSTLTNFELTLPDDWLDL